MVKGGARDRGLDDRGSRTTVEVDGGCGRARATGCDDCDGVQWLGEAKRWRAVVGTSMAAVHEEVE